jgi:hypothetical protein
VNLSKIISRSNGVSMNRFSSLPMLLIAGCILSARPALADQIGDGLLSVTQKVGPAIVSIRADEELTVQFNGRTNDADATIDFHGVAVSPDGLIMCSNTYFSGDRYKNAIGASDDSSSSVSVSMVPREIRVTIGDEPTEYYATVAASDSNLGLDFLQIRDLKGRVLPFVDLAAAAAAFSEPIIGEPTTSVTRLDKVHQYATLAIEDRVASILAKPRKGYLPEGDAGSLGLPVCNTDGDVIGVITSLPTPPSSTEDRQSEAFARLYNDDISIDHTELIVPVTNISPVVAEAKARAADLPPFTPPAPKPAVVPTPTTTTPATPATAPLTKPVTPATGASH